MAKSRIAKTPAGDKLRDRALYCRRLAAGVGDPEFTLKLTALADGCITAMGLAAVISSIWK